MPYYFAPMEGITTSIYRSIHQKHFPGADRYYMPFFSPTSDHLMTPRELRDIEPMRNVGVNAIPQILTKNAEDFLWAANELAEMGYNEVNLNLGCPSATVTAKGKGAGLLLHPRELNVMLETIFSRTPIAVSVKTRIGYHEAGEWEALLSIYNQYPIHELIVHPRTRKEMYNGETHSEAFELALYESRAPVIYNGNLFTSEDSQDFLTQHPATPQMLGRGAAADPSLFRQLHGGAKLTKEELYSFHTELYAAYREELGGQNAMRKMKELWTYLLFLFNDDGNARKKLARSKDTFSFEAEIAQIMQTLSFSEKIRVPFLK